MDNFILLDGWSLAVAIGIDVLMCLCGIFLGFCTVFQERENKKLKKENKELSSELSMKFRQLTIANSTLGFLKHRVRELEEEISVRDEAIVAALKCEVNGY